ncbi:MAG: DUF4157 domain-containing protein [Saprospiraceae bacterium]|nr:DUF4157 domain-containing protein [Saprospiraceae bacterium]
MKTTASKENSTPSKSSQPFFNKKGEGSFLSSKNEVEHLFFLPSYNIQRDPVNSSFSGGQNFANIPICSPRSQPVIQTKLTINEPGDKYEQEADSMADRVMRMNTPVSANGDENLVQTKPLNNTTIQRKCAACENDEKVQRQEMEEERLQAKPLMSKSAEGGGYTASPQLASQLNSSKGGGAPLPKQTLGSMNQAFGADFSKVRIHTGARAAEMSQGIQAKAFTHGSDIYFNQGQYSPESSEGKRLLGHELTHVMQQKRTFFTNSPDTHNNEVTISTKPTIQLEPLDDLKKSLKTWREKSFEGVLKSYCKAHRYGSICHEINKNPALDQLFTYDNTNTSEVEILYVLKLIRRFGDDDEKRKAQKTLSENGLYRLWQESSKPFAGYKSMFPDYSGYPFNNKEYMQDLGLSDSAPIKSVRDIKSNKLALESASILFFRGHHYGEYGDPGLYTNNNGSRLIDMKVFEETTSFPKVKLIISTSCATLCKESISLFSRLFPNAVMLGYKQNAPYGDAAWAALKEELLRLKKPLFLETETDINAIIQAWESVIIQRHPNPNWNTDFQPGWYKNPIVKYWGRGKVWHTLNASDTTNKCRRVG